MRNALIIDGKNLAWRAGVVEDLTNRRGQPVYVPFVGLKMLHSMVKRFKPVLVVFAWDGGTSKWRREVYPDYKARKKVDVGEEGEKRRSEIFSQLTVFKSVLSRFPVFQFSQESQEADDLIASFVNVLHGIVNPIIISTDQDFYQLLDRAAIFHTAKETLYKKEQFEKEFGFTPDRWTEYRAMVGDASDNIKGVDGIGPKTAAQVIVEHGGFEAYCETGTGKTKEKAVRQTDVFKRNVCLIDLEAFPDSEELTDACRTKLSAYRPGLDKDWIQNYFVQNQFFSMLKQFPVWIRVFEQLSRDWKPLYKNRRAR